jgi:hypothetical protein
MKKTLIILAIGALIAIIYFAFFYKTAEAPNIENTEPETEVKDLSITGSSKQISANGYEVDFKFPVTGEERIDSEISNIVNQLTSTFEDEAKSFLPNPSGEDRDYTLIANYEAKLGDKYDTFVFLMSVDFGGAHPNHFYRTVTFDKNQSVISIEDLLKREFGGTGVLDKISGLAQEKIANKLGENVNTDMLEAGTKPSFDSFKNFYIDGESIVFLFEPYAVAPYAYSTQEAKISFSEIKI